MENLMGAKLSKFSKLGHIQTFQGVMVQENQTGDESDHFSDESETFYSEFYVYENIVNIETDSNWVISNYWLFYLHIVQLGRFNKNLDFVFNYGSH